MEYPAKFVALKGEYFEVLAISEKEDPTWYYGKTESGDFGWVSELVLDCEGIERPQLFFRAYPILPKPTEVPDDGKPEGCHEKMGPVECRELGGIWKEKCFCPD